MIALWSLYDRFPIIFQLLSNCCQITFKSLSNRFPLLFWPSNAGFISPVQVQRKHSSAGCYHPSKAVPAQQHWFFFFFFFFSASSSSKHSSAGFYLPSKAVQAQLRWLYPSSKTSSKLNIAREAALAFIFQAKHCKESSAGFYLPNKTLQAQQRWLLSSKPEVSE